MSDERANEDLATLTMAELMEIERVGRKVLPEIESPHLAGLIRQRLQAVRERMSDFPPGWDAID